MDPVFQFRKMRWWCHQLQTCSGADTDSYPGSKSGVIHNSGGNFDLPFNVGTDLNVWWLDDLMFSLDNLVRRITWQARICHARFHLLCSWVDHLPLQTGQIIQMKLWQDCYLHTPELELPTSHPVIILPRRRRRVYLHLPYTPSRSKHEDSDTWGLPFERLLVFSCFRGSAVSRATKGVLFAGFFQSSSLGTVPGTPVPSIRTSDTPTAPALLPAGARPRTRVVSTVAASCRQEQGVARTDVRRVWRY
jgi:hypothetical protein